MRFLTAGESHGPGLTAIIEGFPSGLKVNRQLLQDLMDARRLAPGRSSRMRLETDTLEIYSGLRGGVTTGSPISLFIANGEWKRWQVQMDPWQPSPEERITIPRPGHADLAGAAAHRISMADVAERASARETAARTAVGGFALQLLQGLAVDVLTDWFPDPGSIAAAEGAKDTLGGRVSVRVTGLPGGVGSYTHWDRRLDGRLAGALMSLPGVKGVEIGAGFKVAALRGSQCHDPYLHGPGGYQRKTNNAGGLEGGVSNGEPILLGMAVKPIPTLAKPLMSFDSVTGKPASAPVPRHDTSAVPAMAVIARATVAWEIACCLVFQFGGATFAALAAALSEQRRYWGELIHAPEAE